MAKNYLSPPIALMYRTPAERAMIARRRYIALVVWIGLVWLLMVAILVVQSFAVFATRHPLQPNVTTVLGFVGAVIVLPIQALFFIDASVPARTELLGSGVLHSAILRADNTLAPHAEHQPEPLLADARVDMWNAPPEHPLCATRIDRFYVVLMLFIVVSGVVYLILMALGILGVSAPVSSDISGFGICGFSFSFGLSALFGNMVAEGSKAFSPTLMQSLVVDDQGIHWREVGGKTYERMLAWQDIEAFCVQKQYFSQSYQSVYTYQLLGRNIHFGWVVRQSPKAPEYLASGLLGQLVVTRTGLPLLDISESADALNRLSHGGQASVLGESARNVRAELERAILAEGQPVVHERPFSRFVLWNVLLMALLTLGFCIVWLLHG